ncbi:hypothetical protein Misp03_17310 [Microbispora sp. NBRC 16548]|nr:hypothetical protein Misp03_17310 [Microbispora sp. NBRC 16548]
MARDGPWDETRVLRKLVGNDGTLTATPAQPGTFIHWGDWDIRIGDDVLAVPDTYRTVSQPRRE